MMKDKSRQESSAPAPAGVLSSSFTLHPSGCMFGPVKKPSRLGQWDGRRRSSRSEDPVLPHLCRVPVLSRLGAVLVTALSVTFLAYTWGPPQSYRVGEICPHDLRARVYFEVVDQAATDRKRDEAVEALPAERRSDPEVCEG